MEEIFELPESLQAKIEKHCSKRLNDFLKNYDHSKCHEINVFVPPLEGQRFPSKQWRMQQKQLVQDTDSSFKSSFSVQYRNSIEELYHPIPEDYVPPKKKAESISYEQFKENLKTSIVPEWALKLRTK